MKSNQFLTIVLLITCFVFSSCIKKNHPPIVTEQEFSVEENTHSGVFVGQVFAYDEDNDKNLTFSILNGNTNDAFEISAPDGKLTVKNEQAIDFETTPVFLLLIEVSDSKDKRASAQITINLENVDSPSTGLILYLPFDGNINDLSTSKNNGINYTSNNYVQGKWAQALDFNGTSDYIKLSNTINSANGLTFSFWIKSRGANGAENNGAIAAKCNMATLSRCFMVYSFGSPETRNDNRLSAAFYKYGNSSAYHDHIKSYLETSELTVFPNPSLWTLVNPLRLETAVWTHCVINVTPTTIEAWINGELCTNKQREYNSYFDSSDEPVYIGNNFSVGEGSNNHFNGVIDELRIYYRGLSTEEIQTLFKEK